MKSVHVRRTVLGLAVLGAILLVAKNSRTAPGDGASGERVFEIRTYTSAEGKLNDVLARFRDHTCKLFEKHGMTNIGYWVPADEPKSANTLIYIIAHPSREEAKKNWDAFRSDPEWNKAREASEVNGKIVTKAESVFVNPTDFSPLK